MQTKSRRQSLWNYFWYCVLILNDWVSYNGLLRLRQEHANMSTVLDRGLRSDQQHLDFFMWSSVSIPWKRSLDSKDNVETDWWTDRRTDRWNAIIALPPVLTQLVNISRGSAATYLCYGQICNKQLSTLLQIYSRIFKWKSFENQLRFDRVTAMGLVYPFYGTWCMLQIRMFRRCVVLPVFSRRVSHWIGISVLRQSSVVTSYITSTFLLLFVSGKQQARPTGWRVWLRDIRISFTCVCGVSTKLHVQPTTLSPHVSNWFVSSWLFCNRSNQDLVTVAPGVARQEAIFWTVHLVVIGLFRNLYSNVLLSFV